MTTSDTPTPFENTFFHHEVADCCDFLGRAAKQQSISIAADKYWKSCEMLTGLWSALDQSVRANNAQFAELSKLRSQLATAQRELEEARADSRRLDWLESRDEQGANTLGHHPPETRGHVYTDKWWEEKASGTRVAHWKHYHAPTLRAAIDAAMDDGAGKDWATP